MEWAPDNKTEEALFLTLISREDQRPWSVAELQLEMGDPTGVIDGLSHLHRAGLIHRCGEFAWASRAAVRANEVAQSL